MELRVDEILTNSLTEDSFVEFKRELPSDHRRAARRIAALSNAARGTEVVWLIGVDDDGTVIGVDDAELSNWWPQVQRCIDDVSPEMSDIVVARPEGRVLALFFTTDRAPYLWKTGGSPELEVPWREGTCTRPARRVELLRLLRPLVNAPDVEVIQATLTIGTDMNSHPRTDKDNPDLLYVDVTLHVETFIDCDSPVSFPTHREVLQIRSPILPYLNNELNISWRVEGKSYGRYSRGSGTALIEVPSVVSVYGTRSHDLVDRQTLKMIGAEPVVQVRMQFHGTGGRSPYATNLALQQTKSSTERETVQYVWSR